MLDNKKLILFGDEVNECKGASMIVYGVQHEVHPDEIHIKDDEETICVMKVNPKYKLEVSGSFTVPREVSMILIWKVK